MQASRHFVRVDVSTYPARVWVDARPVQCTDFQIGQISAGNLTIILEVMAESIEIGGTISADSETTI